MVSALTESESQIPYPAPVRGDTYPQQIYTSERRVFAANKSSRLTHRSRTMLDLGSHRSGMAIQVESLTQNCDLEK